MTRPRAAALALAIIALTVPSSPAAAQEPATTPWVAVSEARLEGFVLALEAADGEAEGLARRVLAIAESLENGNGVPVPWDDDLVVEVARDGALSVRLRGAPARVRDAAALLEGDGGGGGGP